MDERQVRDLVGELLVAGFDGKHMNDHARRLIVHHRVRNIILFSRNVESVDQVQALTAELQQAAKESGADLPLLICLDQENGVVRRVDAGVPGLPGNMALGAAGSRQYAHRVGEVTGRLLLELGVNMNLAPVLDVNNNPQNPVIGVRSYGEDPHLVATLGSACIKGMLDAGVIACGKHFPGHGDTNVDSHLDVPVVDHGRDRLEQVELVPFRAAIAAGVEVLMAAHIALARADAELATTSKAVLTDLLRGELGFEGVVTTDCLEMNAIAKTMGVGEGAVRALQAGADLIMVSHRLDRQEDAIESVVRAVMEGRLSLQRLEEAAARVRDMKQHRLRLLAEPTSSSLDDVYKEALQLQQEVCAKAVTVVRNTAGVLPVNADQIKRVGVWMDGSKPVMNAADATESRTLLAEAVQRAVPKATVNVQVLGSRGDTAFDVGAWRSHDLLVAGANGLMKGAFREAVLEAVEGGLPVVLIALQSPYDLAGFSRVPTCIALYEYTPWMVDAGVRAVFGAQAGGRLPVTIQV